MIHCKGIMFDMDNTLLSSNINFEQMTRELTKIVVDYKIEPWVPITESTTPAEIIEMTKRYERQEKMSGIEKQMWNIIEKCEQEGMVGAELEEGALEVVSSLSKDKTLVIVTNNATKPAISALTRTGIIKYFDYVFGRDRLGALKPSSDSIKTVLGKYETLPGDWVMVGDSWIDGKASIACGVPFISYRGDEKMLKEKDVKPIKKILHLKELL